MRGNTRGCSPPSRNPAEQRKGENRGGYCRGSSGHPREVQHRGRLFSLALADLDRIRDADPRLLTPADLEPFVDAGILQEPITDATILPSSRALALYVSPTALRDHARSIHRYNDADKITRRSRSDTYYDGRTDANGNALIGKPVARRASATAAGCALFPKMSSPLRVCVHIEECVHALKMRTLRPLPVATYLRVQCTPPRMWRR